MYNPYGKEDEYLAMLIVTSNRRNERKWFNMVEKLVKLEDLYKKYPFIYELSGDYYIIGLGICKLCCSSNAITYYEAFKKSLNEVGIEKVTMGSYDVAEDKLDTLLYYFRKVIAYCDIAVDDAEPSTFRKKIENLISSLSNTRKDELLRQLKIFVNLFYYYYRRF